MHVAFAAGAGKGLDLDSLHRRQMREPLKRAESEWEGWRGFRRGLATNLERIGVRESIAAMIPRHANERVTWKHYIKPPTHEAIRNGATVGDCAALEKPSLLSACSPEHPSTTRKPQLSNGFSKLKGTQMYVTEAVRALIPNVVNCSSARRRGGRVAECGGLLNRCTG